MGESRLNCKGSTMNVRYETTFTAATELVNKNTEMGESRLNCKGSTMEGLSEALLT